MKKLKPGTVVKITDEHTKWLSDHADELAGYPRLFLDKDHVNIVGETRNECLSQYLMDKYSYPSNEPIHGVICGDNNYTNNNFAYIVWVVNKIGEDIVYIDPKDLEVL